MEVGQEVKIIMVYQRCDKCGEGYMETDGNVVLCSFPPKFPHVCSNCGFKEIYRKKYPYCYLTECTSFKKNKIKLIIANGYEVLHYEDFFRNGYRIDYDDWTDLLKYLGYEVEYKEISDEEMEEML